MDAETRIYLSNAVGPRSPEPRAQLRPRQGCCRGRRVVSGSEAAASHPGGHVGVRPRLVQAVRLHDQRRERLVASHVRQVCLIELGPFGEDVVGLNSRIGHTNL